MSATGPLVAPAGRSFTNLLTNTTVLPAIRARSDLGAVVKGSLPRDSLLPFLHEATHNWCFLTPVGTALATLAARARLDAWGLTNRETMPHDALRALLDSYLLGVYG